MTTTSLNEMALHLSRIHSGDLQKGWMEGPSTIISVKASNSLNCMADDHDGNIEG